MNTTFHVVIKNMKINEMIPPHSLSLVLIIRYFHSSSCVVGRVLYESMNIKFVIAAQCMSLFNVILRADCLFTCKLFCK